MRYRRMLAAIHREYPEAERSREGVESMVKLTLCKLQFPLWLGKRSGSRMRRGRSQTVARSALGLLVFVPHPASSVCSIPRVQAHETHLRDLPATPEVPALTSSARLHPSTTCDGDVKALLKAPP